MYSVSCFSGIVLNRVAYYTIPSMEDLAEMVDENGECVVENFTVGRKGNACLRLFFSVAAFIYLHSETAFYSQTQTPRSAPVKHQPEVSCLLSHAALCMRVLTGLSYYSALIGPHRLRLHLLPRRGERGRTEPRRDRPLQTQRGHRVPGRQKQAARGGGA